MATTNYFGNSGASSGSVASPFYQIKPQKNPYQTYKAISDTTSLNIINAGVNIWRSGVGNNIFSFDSGGKFLNLKSVNSSGITSTIASTSYTGILVSSFVTCVHVNTADQCVYVLLKNGSDVHQLVKVNDSTGVVTTIGSSFTPSTPTNWPLTGRTTKHSMILDTVSGHLKVTFNGYYHLINKTTGAIVSQNTAIVIGGYNLSNLGYYSLDGTIATNSFSAGLSVSSNTILPEIVSSSTGHLPRQEIPTTLLGFGTYNSLMVTGTIDSDKLIVGELDISGSTLFQQSVILRADYDRWLQSVVDYFTT